MLIEFVLTFSRSKGMEANNEFAVTLEKRHQDVPRFVFEVKKVVPKLILNLKLVQVLDRANVARLSAAEESESRFAILEARLCVAENERKAALKQVSSLEWRLESDALNHVDVLCRSVR